MLSGRPENMAALDTLPNEILSLVTSYLERPRDVLHLSLANRRLHEFTKLDGWKEYLKGRFGLSTGDSDARNTVHGISTLHRNWARKAFITKYVKPITSTSLNTWEEKSWRASPGQTMGYKPSIDSYEEIQGGWTDRREVLAWSAGTQFVMRVKKTESKAEKISWHNYKIPDSSEGRDDITALELLRPHQRDENSDCIALGSASGHLSLLRMDLDRKETRTQHYNTEQQTVGSLSISPNSTPLMAATLGGSSLALYPVNADGPDEEEQQHLSQVTPGLSGAGRLASCSFISKDKIAVGLNSSHEPIEIFEITPTGFSPNPFRKYSLQAEVPIRTSVNPIIPLSPSSRMGSEAGHIFLSGGYDGIIRLHDIRSPRDYDILYWDVTNDSSIYSLATQGLDRIVAGTSMHSLLKVFDLRVSGSHAYQSIPLSSQSQKQKSNLRTGDYAENKIVNETRRQSGTSLVTGGWNLFLHPRNYNRVLHRDVVRTGDSPVYSLSIPSDTSPSLYAGVEGAVMGLDFLSVTDKHPDPLFSHTIERFPDANTIDIKRSYNLGDDVLNFGMYGQGNEYVLDMKLMVQGDVTNEVRGHAERRDKEKFQGLDERWKDPSDDSERWSRGQQPQGRRGRPDRGRGGRGRGSTRGRGRGNG